MIPMQMPVPMQPQVGQGGPMNPQQGANLLAGLTEKMTKKVFSTVTENMANQITQHATDALNHGVPFGHILDELLKASPLTAGNNAGQDMAKMMGGGGTPPGGPQPPNGGGPPPPGGPTPMGKQDDTSQQGMSIQMNPGQLQNSPYQQGQPGFAPQAAPMMSGTMQNTQAQPTTPFNMPSFLGIKPSAQNQVLLTQAALGQQELIGQKPMQVGEIQRAERVPQTQQEKAMQTLEEHRIESTALRNKADVLTAKVKAYDDNEANLQKQLESYGKLRGPINTNVTGGPSKEQKVIQNSIKKAREERAAAYGELASLYGGSGGESAASGLPHKGQIPRGAKFYDSDKKKWVF